MNGRRKAALADIVQRGRERLDAGDDFTQVHRDMDSQIRSTARAEVARDRRATRGA